MKEVFGTGDKEEETIWKGENIKCRRKEEDNKMEVGSGVKGMFGGDARLSREGRKWIEWCLVRMGT